MFKSANERIRKFFERPINRAIDAAAGLFGGLEALSDEDKEMLALIKAVLPTDTAEMEKALLRFRAGLEKQQLSELKISNLLDFIRSVAPSTPERSLPVLRGYTAEHQRQVITHLLAIALDHGEYRAGSWDIISRLAGELGIPEAEFMLLADEIKKAEVNRSKIIRSGTGIILALIVIGLFVLIATWLSSLLFGLVLAYIFLPLERFFEKRVSSPPGVVRRVGDFLFGWLGRIRKKLTRPDRFKLSEEEIARRERKAITTKAVTLTVSCVVFGCLAVLVAAVILLNSYVTELKTNIKGLINNKTPVQEQVVEKSAPGMKSTAPAVKTAVASGAAKKVQSVPKQEKTGPEPQSGVVNSMKNWARRYDWGKRWFPQTGSAAAAAAPDQHKMVSERLNDRLLQVLDNLKQRFQKLPLVQDILTELSEYLADGKAGKQLTKLLMQKSGGLFAFLAKFVAAFASFLLNVLMTFFFFSLLLGKLAEFRNSVNSDSNQPPTGYLIRTVFNGNWLPKMSEENLAEGDRVVGEVFNKLRTWLRGYMTMIAIDFCVYTTVFALLKVPYAPILGAVAAVGILLPYIGPVASALLSVLVTLAVGGSDVSVVQIAGIICAYLIHNGIIEQFFIYPAIIGESLGLTTLETIIVVLLGGIIAGIPGLIFALPAASVIKYLVPQIYRCWR